MARTVDEIVIDYSKFAKAMLGVNSTLTGLLDELAKSFDKFQLSNEQVGEVTAQAIAAAVSSFNKDAITAATDWETKEYQAMLLKRQIQGYDDNMLLKIVEHQGGLASFAVNAGADNMDDVVQILKQKMASVEARVPQLSGAPACPPIAKVVSIPKNLVMTNAIGTQIDIKWDSVISATQYLVYRDGVLVATSDKLTFVDTNLTAKTKYAYTIMAAEGALKSGFTPTLVIATT